jgi:hypothetical protein
MKENREIFMYAIRKDQDNFRHLSQKLQEDKEIVSFAIQHGKVLIYSRIMYHISEKLQHDRDIIFLYIQSLTNVSSIYRFRSDYKSIIENDKEIIKYIVHRNGYLLKITR